MDIIIDHPTAYAIVSVIVVMLATSLVQWTFLIKLKKHHAQQWDHAGNPTIWSDQSLLSAWPTIKYLQNKTYVSSRDTDGIKFCDSFRLPMIIGYWVTVAAFIMCLVVWMLNGWPSSWS